MREYQDGSQEEYWGEKEIAELRELNVAAFREIAYLKNQKESLREVNAELLGILKHIIGSYELTDSDLFESKSAIAKSEKLK